MPFGSEILAMLKRTKEQKVERRITCPECEWPLEEKNGVLHCRLCGWCESLIKKRR